MCTSECLNAAGLAFAFLGTILLLRFGITFRGDQPGVPTGKDWTKLGLSIECGQRISFLLLVIGFGLQLLSQLMS